MEDHSSLVALNPHASWKFRTFAKFQFPSFLERAERRPVYVDPTIGRSGIAFERLEWSLLVERTEFIQPIDLDQELGKRTDDGINVRLPGRIVLVKVQPNPEPKRTR